MKKKLLDKYYKGETSLGDEEQLKKEIFSEKGDSSEKDMFGYFQHKKEIPEGLEEYIFTQIKERNKRKKTRRIWLYRISSAAAVILIFFSVYNYFRIKNAKMENNFSVMEQALYKVSESIQPEEQNEMLVLWVDNDVQIIIN